MTEMQFGPEVFEVDVSSVVNNYKGIPFDGQMTVVNANIDFLNSAEGAATYGISDLVYLSKVWHEVKNRLVRLHETEAEREAQAKAPVVGNKRYTKRWDA